MLEKVLSQADADFPRHLERLQRYIQQPSVSAEKRGNTEMAQLIAAEIETMGGVAKVVPGVDFPIVYGRFDVGAARTVILHSLYDTTPADEPGWVVPPFEGRRMNFEDLGDCIVGRGAEDTKGPLTTLMNAVHAYRAAGVRLPCNVVMIYEASELGSASLPPFIAAHAAARTRASGRCTRKSLTASRSYSCE
jgi:acetylornithine deacetylase/succinyl-diaminopimelate desuccinylase-like protein